MIRHYLLLACGALLFCACTSIEPTEQQKAAETHPLEVGNWRFSLSLGENELPFNAQVYLEEGLLLMDILNAEERITISDIREEGDSLFLRMPLFDSEFKGIVSSDGSYSGVWANYDKGDYVLPFTATHGIDYRFCMTDGNGIPSEFSDKYSVAFSPGSAEDEYPAIGQFETQKSSNKVTGTFMTETGDYRFLEGNFCDGRLYLSCFDGSHAFRFEASVKGDSLIDGTFQSGKHWKEPWMASADEKATLADPHELTSVIDTSALDGLHFPGPNGTEYALNERAAGKVTILQVMGSWCPNCIDETLVFKEFHHKYHDQGLEIVPIAFESEREAQAALKTTKRLGERLDLPYPIYYGGYRNKQEAQKRLPFLDTVISFPTSIILDKKGRVRDVHTGFYGPGTKDYYTKYVEDTERLITALLAE